MCNQTSKSSIKTVTNDGEFIEFLKNISLYVTSDDSPRDEDGGSKLFKNLEYLRDKFKDFKLKKQTTISY